tara:strand:- start:1885 stop:2988 length:1104 start_codon:yes stop_codon:yes gene_type:complete
MILKLFPPKKNDILFYDENFSLNIARILKLKTFGVLHTRKEVLNIFILLKTFLKLKFSFFSYLQEYINYISPKILITFTDNDKKFYQLICKNGYKVFIQNGRRTKMDIFYFLKKNKKYYVDYMFTHNQCIGELYKKFISGTVVPVGSIWSNEIPINKSSKKNFLYISSFRSGYLSNTGRVFQNIFFKNYIKNEIVLLKKILKYCKSKKIKLVIMGKYFKSNSISKKEFSFYKKILGSNFIFYKNSEKRNNFKVLDEFKIIIGIESTLVYEAFGRNKKVAFFNVRGSQNSLLKSRSFAWPHKVPKKGFFWTDKINDSEVSRIFTNLLKTSMINWRARTLLLRKKTMLFDSNNKKIKSFVYKLLNNPKY